MKKRAPILVRHFEIHGGLISLLTAGNAQLDPSRDIFAASQFSALPSEKNNGHPFANTSTEKYENLTSSEDSF